MYRKGPEALKHPFGRIFDGDTAEVRVAQAGAKFLPPFCTVTAPGRSTDEGQAISCAWRIKPKLKTRSRRPSNTRLSNRRFCAFWTIRKFSRKSSPC